MYDTSSKARFCPSREIWCWFLVEVVKKAAKQAGCTRVWLVTTNDNVDALRFYQRRGFVLVELRPNAIEAARALKPEIPLIGQYGILLRDELYLEMSLTEEM